MTRLLTAAQLALAEPAVRRLREAGHAGARALAVSIPVAAPIREATAAADGSVPVVVLREGHGNPATGNYYDAAFVRSLALLVDGAIAYYNHPSAFDEQNRPERDVRERCGWYSDAAVLTSWRDPSAPGATPVSAVAARLHPRSGDPEIASLLATAREKAARLPTSLGFVALSISAIAAGAPGTAPDGRAATICSVCTALESIDLVTVAGAGGQIATEAAREAARLSNSGGSSRGVLPRRPAPNFLRPTRR